MATVLIKSNTVLVLVRVRVRTVEPCLGNFVSQFDVSPGPGVLDHYDCATVLVQHTSRYCKMKF
jgi:hypothetical protein